VAIVVGHWQFYGPDARISHATVKAALTGVVGTLIALVLLAFH
jgi:hypothetical protein